jgi:hypothetical protein
LAETLLLLTSTELTDSQLIPDKKWQRSNSPPTNTETNTGNKHRNKHRKQARKQAPKQARKQAPKQAPKQTPKPKNKFLVRPSLQRAKRRKNLFWLLTKLPFCLKNPKKKNGKN